MAKTARYELARDQRDVQASGTISIFKFQGFAARIIGTGLCRVHIRLQRRVRFDGGIMQADVRRTR